MFDALTGRLGQVFDKLTGRGALSEADVDAALREVRLALLEADVALSVVKDFLAAVRERAVGAEVLKSVKPGQQVVKIVHDELVRVLGGGEPEGLRLGPPPSVILLAGLQGSGKTTSAAKLARRLKTRDHKNVLLASLDTRRPAAMEQLKQLAEKDDVAFLPIVEGQDAPAIAKRALEAAKFANRDVVILDTAGRTTLDAQLMDELARVHALAKPVETLLVADSLTGQDAVETAKAFKERVPVTGLILTRADGDGRGGAILSMRAVTGAPVKFLGVGERSDALDAFDAARVAGRILGMGDVVGLVEKAQETVEAGKAEAMAKRMAQGRFDLDDMAEQLRQLSRMGGFGAFLGFMPGVGKLGKALQNADVDDKELRRQAALISSMTKAERRDPKVLNASRKKRVAAGAGVTVAEVNKVLKLHRQMADMMKMMGKGGAKGLLGALGGGGDPGGATGGALPSMPSMPGGMLPPGFGAPVRGRKATKKKPKRRRK